MARWRRLAQEVDRPNLLIKIPATVEDLPAIRTAIRGGTSVNVTLIFSLERYRAVMTAYLDGLEDRMADGAEVKWIASVASFFASRVDTAVDKQLDAMGTQDAAPLLGKAAVANARLAYRAFEETFSGPRWERLAAAGARPQRPLWASTGVKDPRYPDTLYVTELVAPGVVNTMPELNLLAMAEHGQVRGDTIRGSYDEAETVLDQLARLGVDLPGVSARLEREGVAKFVAAWEALLASVSAETVALTS
jgi:transaldolase